MNISTHHQSPPPYSPSQEPSYKERDDWEDWEDDDVVTPIDTGMQVMPNTQHQHSQPVSVRTSRATSLRPSGTSGIKLNRLKSRRRQKAQNAKLGISLITDMTTLRRPNQPAQHQLRAPDGRPVKFVDAAALRALEGEPNSASVGNWNWIKKSKMQSPASATTQKLSPSPLQQLSPEDRPIVIGISLPEDEMSQRGISPQTAGPTTTTPHDLQGSLQIPQNPPRRTPDQDPHVIQPKSVWSPDTPDTVSSFSTIRVASSIYPQTPKPGFNQVPPVPAVPSTYKKTHHQRLISLELGKTAGDEDESGTPCTLFEEDGIASPHKQTVTKAASPSPNSAVSKTIGWWDHHVVTPFLDKRQSFSSRKQRIDSPNGAKEEWWNSLTPKVTQTQHLAPQPSPAHSQTPIIRAPTPNRAPTPPSVNTAATITIPSAEALRPRQNSPVSEKRELESHVERLIEQPPPYASEKRERESPEPVRYKAVFPPGHPLHSQRSPSPAQNSPGLAATMSSQGATPMTDIPLTPAPRGDSRPSRFILPIRPVGTYLPQEHSHDARGDMNRIERQRRRHEKEELVARRVGGFWRGRGCIPQSGCFGRTGREGRKKRRVCVGIWCAVTILLILVIVLPIVLTRPRKTEEVPSIWVNLTDFPPMPTGVLTVVGSDNTVARSGCTEPSTMWSCSLPKEQHESVAPYRADQPTIVMQIQWDNDTQNAWDAPNGNPPSSVPRRSLGQVQKRQKKDFKAQPSAPSFEEMWFLGNTTDNVQADEKGGEATPFYISLLESVEDGEPGQLGKRETPGEATLAYPTSLPPPDLKKDGTPKPAVLLPKAVHQPVRLYDRGLDTEHYGFYTYFKRTIYLKSVTVLEGSKEDDIPLDRDGGCRETEADFLTTWGETRLLVRIWTRTLESNTSALLSSEGQKGIGGSKELIRPGTMPYPVTVTLDTHGGDPTKKFVWDWPIDERQHLDLKNPKLLSNDIGFAGTWINKRSRGDPKHGGYDGGTGGCKCEWVNFVRS